MFDKPIFNSFDSLPFIPYNILSHLANDPLVEDLWKLLKYNTYDALSQPNLTFKQKMSMIWKNQATQNNYTIFLTRLIEDEQLSERTILKLYKANSDPVSAQIATTAYEFDILVGAKIPMVDYNGIPCSRVDVIESLLLKSLNGADVNGVGWLQFNDDLSRLCRSATGVGNNTSYYGTSILMAVQIGNLNDRGC